MGWFLVGLLAYSFSFRFDLQRVDWHVHAKVAPPIGDATAGSSGILGEPEAPQIPRAAPSALLPPAGGSSFLKLT